MGRTNSSSSKINTTETKESTEPILDSVTKVEEKDLKTEIDVNELLKTISFLSKQIEDLKNNSITNQNETPVVIAKMDKPCTLIHLLECNPSLPTTIRVNNIDLRFSKFGEKRTFRFSEMQDIISRYYSWFERGVFTLGSDCEEFKDDFGLSIMNIPMSIAQYNSIAKLPMEEFKRIISGITFDQSVLLAKTWIQRYESGSAGYSNLDKIRVLNTKTKGFMKEFMSVILDDDSEK